MLPNPILIIKAPTLAGSRRSHALTPGTAETLHLEKLAQRAHNPLIKEYSLNHNMKPYIM